MPGFWARLEDIRYGFLGEMGNGEFAVFGFAVGRQKEKVVGFPRGTLPVSGSFFDDKRAEDAAQDDNRQALLLEAHPEDPPRLTARERAELLDFLDPHGRRLVDPEILRLIVERDVLWILGVNRPVELVTEERNQFPERSDVSELFGFADMGGHLFRE
jgi:hypothetical protein